MPQISGPYTPTPGVPIVVSNPAQGGGNLVSSLAVIVNISPYELVVSSGASSGSGLVDPFTRDGVSLDPTAGEQIVIMPLDIGFSPPDGVDPTIYVLWYLPTESAPTALPVPIVPYGNLQSVDLVGQPIYVNDIGSNGTSGPVTATVSAAVVIGVPPAGYSNFLSGVDYIGMVSGQECFLRDSFTGIFFSGATSDKTSPLDYEMGDEVSAITNTGTCTVIVRYRQILSTP